VTGTPNMARLERLVAALPEATRVDVVAWGGEPTFRVRDKTFVFADPDATSDSDRADGQLNLQARVNRRVSIR